MKLVEILARELKWWPHCVSIVQDYDGYVGLYSSSALYLVNGDIHEAVWHHQYHIRNIAELSKIASDHATAIVTRDDWEAERARIAKPAGKPNKDGWIRHRGGKCPVDDGVKIDYKTRDGEIDTFGRDAGKLCWSHFAYNPCNIMAYRIHKPAEQGIYADDKDEPSEPVQVTYVDSDGPLQWRDRITEIDRTVEALEEERVSLVQRLEVEGFRLIERAVQPVEDMSDWRNWKVGDLITCMTAEYADVYEQGKSYAVKEVGDLGALVFDDCGAGSCCSISGRHADKFKWHSRPSK